MIKRHHSFIDFEFNGRYTDNTLPNALCLRAHIHADTLRCNCMMKKKQNIDIATANRAFRFFHILETTDERQAYIWCTAHIQIYFIYIYNVMRCLWNGFKWMHHKWIHLNICWCASMNRLTLSYAANDDCVCCQYTIVFLSHVSIFEYVGIFYICLSNWSLVFSWHDFCLIILQLLENFELHSSWFLGNIIYHFLDILVKIVFTFSLFATINPELLAQTIAHSSYIACNRDRIQKFRDRGRGSMLLVYQFVSFMAMSDCRCNRTHAMRQRIMNWLKKSTWKHTKKTSKVYM